MSAAQCLKHEWLRDLPAKARQCQLRLKSQLLLQSYMAHRKWKVEEISEYVCQACVSLCETFTTPGDGHEAVAGGLSVSNFYPCFIT
ncbi:hypothetical protein DUI87_14063 [Hirundo rustica rustica]|uniref:Uncharacterized protein n=1 Tax=Hirundo rustica rustica TaxID=333673 RepID=A0A3M0K7C7_HIRRU|nr:hypothetical protein DUI87_14063 [Hirundo rustica rustica]